MSTEQWSGIIQAVGFPIACALGMAWALYKVGTRLLESHIGLVTATTGKMEEANKTLDNVLNELALSRQEQQMQTHLLRTLPDEMAKACKADEVCENFKALPKQKG